MTDATEFVKQVKDALEYLYDPTHLQIHPLLESMTLQRLPNEPASVALRRALWEAVEALKPPDSLPPQRPEWLNYRLLWLHYIQAMDREIVQRDLGLAERTFYRRIHEAVEAVASVLWETQRSETPDRGGVRETHANSGSPARLARQNALRLIHAGQAERVSLVQVATSAELTVRPLYTQRECSLTLDIPPDLPQVRGDPAVLHQIAVNALLGALEVAGPDGLTLYAQYQDGVTVWRVSGLCMATSPKELFGQSPIALSRELAQGCGGDLWLAHGAQGTPELCFSMMSVRPTVILTIDDDADARQLLGRLLSSHGYVVREAPSAQAVPAILEEVAPDLILLDVLMPQQDGWELLRYLKTTPKVSSVPVVICSVLSQVSLAIALGAAAVVQKPVSEEILVKTCSRVLAETAQT